MAKQFQIRSNGSTGDAYIYIEDSASQSLAIGSDGATQVFTINMATTANVAPVEATAVLAIQPSTGDIVLQSEPGTGTLTVTVADTTFTTGNVTVTAGDVDLTLGNVNLTDGNLNITLGNINLPLTATDESSGMINVHNIRFIHSVGDGNTYVGSAAGPAAGGNSGTGNVGIGLSALGNTTLLTSHGFNTAVGYTAGLLVSSGENNTLIGTQAGASITTSSNNTIVGKSAAQTTVGATNTIIGSNALLSATSGDNNCALGYQSLYQCLTGSRNLALGTASGANYVGAESNNILIGNSGTAAESNVIRIGTDGSGSGQQNTAYVAGIYGSSVSSPTPVYVNSSGQLGTAYSTPTSFSAYRSATVNNVTGDGTAYVGIFDTVVFNNGSGYNNATGIFTAPTAGYYQLNATVGAANLGAAHTLGQTYIVTTSQTYFSNYDNYYASSSGGIIVSSQSRLVFLNSGDTAKVTLGVYNSTKTVGFYGGAIYSSFSGFLIQAVNSPVSFGAYQSTNPTNVTGDGTAYTVAYDTTLFNVGSGFNTGTHVFTAPNTGRYQFNINVGLGSLGAGHTLGTMQLVTTARTYTSNYASYGAVRASNNIYMQSFSQLADMTAGDTAYVVVTVSNSTKTVGLYGGNVNSSFSGFQV